ncbi:hypothetical protein PR202_ga20981 [Eleusine coracana subsp. coracana]|uniref:Flavin-containing monooxygenase n=1 Tax=Eleusine coracana subsp. coracana TaxID=191504 RepID=A0AAV5CZG3_ELECO|nr:hypothetical protein PR202_ga20981 [Eleusine coracana subsp. coracana]
MEKKSGREKKDGARNGGASRGGSRDDGASRGGVPTTEPAGAARVAGASLDGRCELERRSGREKKSRREKKDVHLKHCASGLYQASSARTVPRRERVRAADGFNQEERVAIVGAGPSFQPVVFQASNTVGGVWARTLASTKLQTPAAEFLFSDFPWPAGTAEFPSHDQVLAYLTAYAKRFGVLERIRLQKQGGRRRVRRGIGAGGGGVETVTYKFDFLILCVGRYGVTKVPKFPPNSGPEVFNGQVVHSMDYSHMDRRASAELIKGKRVVVVGSGKSGLDTAAECATANGSPYPCTLIYRTANWMVDPKLTWGLDVGRRTTSRLAELMVHKPEEGVALSLLATLLTPLRWLLSTVTETYYKMHMPMLRKNGMVPDCTISHSLKLKRCNSFSFCADGLVLDSGERIDADMVILSTGFDSDKLLSSVFTSPWFREIVTGPSSDTMLPLYRPMAVVGFAESRASIYPYEMMAKWVAHLLDGTVRLPSVKYMERSVAEWVRWGQGAKRRSGSHFLKSCIATITTWYHDQLCRDMGYGARRKKGFLAELLEPYGPMDYADIK